LGRLLSKQQFHVISLAIQNTDDIDILLFQTVKDQVIPAYQKPIIDFDIQYGGQSRSAL
jgi:hypothetical protein